VSFPTVSADSGGVAVIGTSAANQTNLSVANQIITNWPSGAALWLVWEMGDSSGKAQGLAIDNLSFSATSVQALVSQSFNLVAAGTNSVLSWQAPAGPKYQLEYKTNLMDANWTLLGNPVSGSGGSLNFTNQNTSTQDFYRLVIIP
jgi:hypothetical protein